MKRKTIAYICIIVLLLMVLVVLIYSTNKRLTPTPDVNNIINGKLKTSNSYDINITTPENKRYDSGMNGYYSGSYSFDNDLINSVPNGFYSNNDVNTFTTVISNWNGHNTTLRLIDVNATGSFRLYFPFGNQSESFTIEFYLEIANAEWFTMNFRNQANETLINHVFALNWLFGTASFGLVWGVLYHWRVDFGISTFVLYVNSIYKGNYSYAGSLNLPVHNIYFVSYDDSEQPKVYIDAIGITAFDNYELGNNLEIGLLVSFDNYTDFEFDIINWSLNEVFQYSILGNFTIPFLAKGQYYLVVYGNDTLSNNRTSDIRHFSILEKLYVYVALYPKKEIDRDLWEYPDLFRVIRDFLNWLVFTPIGMGILITFIIIIASIKAYIVYRNHYKR